LLIVIAFAPAVARCADVDKKDLHAQHAIHRLETARSESHSEMDRAELQREIGEVRSAMKNNHRSPLPYYVDFLELPILLLDALNNPVGHGYKPASNIHPEDPHSDLSALDPPFSSFWQRPSSIRSADLRAGFDRADLPDYDQMWSYFGPKKSGWNAGCVFASGGTRVKVKFAETHSEPFTSRIFHALGYNVDPTDYAPSLKFKYDRRFFEEFNSRRPLKMRTGMFLIPMFRYNLQPTHDPFNFIDRVVLKSGATIAAPEFKALLLNDSHSSDGFNSQIESQIDYLVTKPANVQIEPAHTHNLGPWDFRRNDHANLRELRGACVLAAWLGWWDCRFENTRLRVVKTPDGPVLKHFWTDLGGGLGRAHGTFSHSCENPNDFSWSFTHSSSFAGKPHFQIKDYEPVEDAAAFAEMTADDARWMARLIGQLTERQIVDALQASGFTPSEVKIYTEKLISRRDNLIRDLQLTHEIALLRPNGASIVAHSDPPKLLSKSR
jgi:hypothetical protein